jgi:hypothetical protein
MSLEKGRLRGLKPRLEYFFRRLSAQRNLGLLARALFRRLARKPSRLGSNSSVLRASRGNNCCRIHIHAMPPHTTISTPLRAWQCSSCVQRTFSTSTARAAVGPEHPQYITFPEPPQQNAPQKKWMKGILPVPRDVFSGKGTRGLDNEEVLEKSTKTAERHGDAQDGR